MAELERLRKRSPEAAKEVTRYFTSTRYPASFMQTSFDPKVEPSTPLEAGQNVGVWKVIELIGSGGMGEVYRAERSDGLYDQTVALKIIQTNYDDNVQWFEAERQRLARLEHSGISRIIDGGTTNNGRPYMAMEYVDGRPIDEYFGQKSPDKEHCLRLFIKLFSAVTHAHNRLILHRDIKAANVLIDVADQPRLIDFGIAGQMGENSGNYSGPFTIAYAAPEQLRREAVSIGTDIFALGVLLHKILIGKRPERLPDGSVQILENDLDADLNAILAKATHFEPDKRYISVSAFSDDIEAYLQTRPVRARDGTSYYIFKKFLHRNALPSGLAAAFLCALTVGLITSLAMADRASKEAVRANAEAARANQELERSEWKIYLADLKAEMSSSFGDALESVYGDVENQDELNDYLLRYHDERTENYTKTNNTSAIKSYVIGRHFLSRNDYVNVRKVTEPWVEKGYGDPVLLSYGHSNLAFAYRNMGEQDKALDMFRRAASFYPGTFEENTIDHAAMLIEVATLSKSAEDLAATESVVDQILANDKNEFIQMYLNYKLAAIAMSQSNWDDTYKFQKRSVAIFDKGNITDISGQDTARNGFAAIEILWNGGLENAEDQLKKSAAIAESKGKSRAFATMLQTRVLLKNAQGDYAGAEEDAQTALPLIEKYSGQSDAYNNLLAYRAINYVDLGDFEIARLKLSELQDSFEETSQWPNVIKTYINLKEKGVSAAQKILTESNIDIEKAWLNLPQNYFMRRMEEQGLIFPEPESHVQLRPN